MDKADQVFAKQKEAYLIALSEFSTKIVAMLRVV